MKKIILLIIASVIATKSSWGQAMGGLEIGLDISNYTLSSTNTNETLSPRTSLRFGFGANFKLTRSLFLEPGVLYLANGSRITDNYSGVSQTSKLNINTLQLPLSVVYRRGGANGSGIFAGLGPYVAYNISGRARWTDDSGRKSSSDLTFGNSPTSIMSKIDFGANIQAGYQTSWGLYGKISYQIGIKDMYTVPGYDLNIRSSAFGISVGWLFKQKGKPQK